MRTRINSIIEEGIISTCGKEMSQSEIDIRNARFWNELCGSSLARSLGIKEVSIESLQQFDLAYLGLYPYQSQHVVR